jgi:hypothetical protein
MAARRKAYTHFRQLLASINRRLQTPQIRQCGGDWAGIDFDKHVTSITMARQRKAFMNVKGASSEPRSFEGDRVLCAKNYTAFVEAAAEGKVRMKGGRVGMDAFVRDAMGLRGAGDHSAIERKAVDAQWADNGTGTNALKHWIGMVDVSSSMEMDDRKPLLNAIGLGIRIAEKSALGKRVLTFCHHPQWFDLDGCSGFCEQVWKLQAAPWGGNTNFYAALQLVLEACKQHRLSAAEVKDMVFVVLSDMQIDQADATNMGTLMETIKEMYKVAGITTVGEPWSPPHLLFWNLRSTDGFPSVSSEDNVTMLSGNNPAMMNAIAAKGLQALEEYTPWMMMRNILSKPRYRHMRAYDPVSKEGWF